MRSSWIVVVIYAEKTQQLRAPQAEAPIFPRVKFWLTTAWLNS